MQGNLVTLSLSGRINMEELTELQKLVDAEGQDSLIVLDLEEVNLVDRDVVKFLARCSTEGIRLEHCPAYIRECMSRERIG